jgi:hypothetical protein
METNLPARARRWPSPAEAIVGPSRARLTPFEHLDRCVLGARRDA